MLYREIIAVCSEIHKKKQVNTLWAEVHAKHKNALWAEHRIYDC